ncbi:MAG: hypothetical protein ACFKPT_17005 [Gloeotrichia echinulata GP01]
MPYLYEVIQHPKNEELLVVAIAVGIILNLEKSQKTINSDKLMAKPNFQKILLFIFQNRAYVSWDTTPKRKTV